MYHTYYIFNRLTSVSGSLHIIQQTYMCMTYIIYINIALTYLLRWQNIRQKRYTIHNTHNGVSPT